MSGVIYWVLWVFFRLLGRLFFRFRTHGEQFLPKNVGVIVAANHASYFDIPLLGCAIRRRVVFLGRANLFPNRFVELGLAGLGMDPVEDPSARSPSFWGGTGTFKVRDTRSDFP